MTIREANNNIKRLEDLLDYWMTEKEIAFERTQPRGMTINGVIVDGGMLPVSKVDEYLIKIERIERDIVEIQGQLSALRIYVENELKRLGEYDPLLKKIILLREVTKLTWLNISIATDYSERQCRRIYSKYAGERNV